MLAAFRVGELLTASVMKVNLNTIRGHVLMVITHASSDCLGRVVWFDVFQYFAVRHDCCCVLINGLALVESDN